jgi:hypothetical protein
MGSNINGTAALETLNAGTQGLFSHVRTNSTTVKQWINGTQLATGTNNSAGLTTLQTYLGCRNDSGTPDIYATNQYSLLLIGAGSLNMVTLNSAVNLLMTNLGAHY